MSFLKSPSLDALTTVQAMGCVFAFMYYCFFSRSLEISYLHPIIVMSNISDKPTKPSKVESLENAPVLMTDGGYQCGLSPCKVVRTTQQSMRNHYHKDHDRYPCNFSGLPKEKKEIDADYRAKKKEQEGNTTLPVEPVRRPIYLKRHADIHGAYNTPGSKIEIKQSLNKRAGLGVFVTSDFLEGDLITKYEGRKSAKYKGTGEYSIQLYGDMFINGIETAIEGRGVGSLVNKPNRGKRPNSYYHEVGKGKTLLVYVAAKKDIPSGTELLCSYSKEYRLNDHKKR
jgi:hypothetical protein